jgi:hypothetical protein
MRNRNLPFLVAVILFAAVAVMGSGCVTSEQAAKARTWIATASPVITELEMGVAELKAELATLPPNDPVRKSLESKIDEGEKALALLKKKSALSELVIKAAETGEIDPALKSELTSLPVVGPYVGILLVAIGFAVRYRKQRGELVDGVNEALPEPTPMQALAFNKPLSPSTQSLVEKARK